MSGSISDQVDNVFCVWKNKDEKRNPGDDALLIVDKQRNGEWEGRIALSFDPEAQGFYGTRFQVQLFLKKIKMNFLTSVQESVNSTADSPERKQSVCAREDVQKALFDCEVLSVVRMFGRKAGSRQSLSSCKSKNTEEVKQPLDYEKAHIAQVRLKVWGKTVMNGTNNLDAIEIFPTCMIVARWYQRGASLRFSRGAWAVAHGLRCQTAERGCVAHEYYQDAATMCIVGMWWPTQGR